MKKLFLFLLLLGSIVTEAKIREVVVSGGFSSISADKVLFAGANFGMQFNHINFEYVNNFATGIGTKSEFTPPFLYSFRERRVSGVNLGYEFSFLGHPKIFLMPTIGFFSMKDVYQTTSMYYYDLYKNKVTFGLTGRYYLNNRIGIGIGRNGIEKFKFSICYVFF